MAEARVDIRPWSAGDLPLLERLLGDPELTMHIGGPESSEAIRARHERYLASDDSAGGVFAIVAGPERAAVGWVGYWAATWHGAEVWEIGWHVLPEHHRKGVASAGASLAIDHARARGSRRDLHAFPAVENAASNALCRRLGFESRGETEVEYPPGTMMRATDWRLDLALPRAAALARTGRSAAHARRPVGWARGPIIMAHRASPHGEPDNTRAACEAAVARGIGAVEIDVRRTSDGVFVLHHDASASGLRVAASTLAELAAIAPGLCTLEEALDVLVPHCLLDVEVKAPGDEEDLVGLLRDRCVPGRYVLSSFDDGIVARLKELAPEVPVGLLLGKRRPPRGMRTRLSELFPVGRLRASGADFAAPHERLLRAGFLRRMDRAGYPALVWTVNDPSALGRLMARREVRVIVTDRAPEAVRLRDEAGPEVLSRAHRVGLWYIFASTPRTWQLLGRVFRIRIEPAPANDDVLSAAEEGAADAVRFTPPSLLLSAGFITLAVQSRPWVSGVLQRVGDGVFLSSARLGFRLGIDHLLAESIALALTFFSVWFVSFASIALAFFPVWLLFRHQLKLAAPVVSVALGLSGDPAGAPRDPRLRPYPRVRYAMGHLFGRRLAMGRKRTPAL